MVRRCLAIISNYLGKEDYYGETEIFVVWLLNKDRFVEGYFFTLIVQDCQQSLL